jgi:hypothetical protein
LANLIIFNFAGGSIEPPAIGACGRGSCGLRSLDNPKMNGKPRAAKKLCGTLQEKK